MSENLYIANINARVENEKRKLKSDFEKRIRNKKYVERITLERNFCYLTRDIDYSPPSQVMIPIQACSTWISIIQ